MNISGRDCFGCLFDMGLLLLDGRRSDKSPLGDSAKLVKDELFLLYPTISLPVMVVLFDLEISKDSDNIIEMDLDEKEEAA